MVEGVLNTAQVLALVVGTAAATAAMYGRYRLLPASLTGPQVCRLEAGGCEVLFRTPAASRLGVPNAALGLLLYVLLSAAWYLGWPVPVLWIGATLGLALSVSLARYLIVHRLQCRVCWAGHAANAVLWLVLLARWLIGGGP